MLAYLLVIPHLYLGILKKSKYQALARYTYKAIWLKQLADKLKLWEKKAMTIWYNNQSSIKIVKNSIFHDITKHFEIDWHFTQQKVEDYTIKAEFIKTTDQPPDILTNAVSKT